MAGVQKQEAISGSKVPCEQARTQMEIQKMQVQAELDAQKLQMQHKLNMQLKQLEVQAAQQKEAQIEDRKDKRTKIQATQQSEMISQRKNDGLPIDFESDPNMGISAFM